jgi:hypothetical protein
MTLFKVQSTVWGCSASTSSSVQDTVDVVVDVNGCMILSSAHEFSFEKRQPVCAFKNEMSDFDASAINSPKIGDG